MSLSKRLAALEVSGSMNISDVRLASDAQLARYLAQTPIAALRSELRTFDDLAFTAVVETIREHVPAYGGSDALA